MESSSHYLTDKELLEDFAQQGAEESFNVLVQPHKLRLFNVAHRVPYDNHAAEDVLPLEAGNPNVLTKSLEDLAENCALEIDDPRLGCNAVSKPVAFG